LRYSCHQTPPLDSLTDQRITYYRPPSESASLLGVDPVVDLDVAKRSDFKNLTISGLIFRKRPNTEEFALRFKACKYCAHTNIASSQKMVNRSFSWAEIRPTLADGAT
jgi:hypothetical protein